MDKNGMGYTMVYHGVYHGIALLGMSFTMPPSHGFFRPRTPSWSMRSIQNSWSDSTAPWEPWGRLGRLWDLGETW